MGFLLNQLYQDNTAVDRIVVVSKWIVCGTTQYIQYLAINPQTVVCHCVWGWGGGSNMGCYKEVTVHELVNYPLHSQGTCTIPSYRYKEQPAVN